MENKDTLLIPSETPGLSKTCGEKKKKHPTSNWKRSFAQNKPIQGLHQPELLRAQGSLDSPNTKTIKRSHRSPEAWRLPGTRCAHQTPCPLLLFTHPSSGPTPWHREPSQCLLTLSGPWLCVAPSDIPTGEFVQRPAWGFFKSTCGVNKELTAQTATGESMEGSMEEGAGGPSNLGAVRSPFPAARFWSLSPGLVWVDPLCEGHGPGRLSPPLLSLQPPKGQSPPVACSRYWIQQGKAQWERVRAARACVPTARGHLHSVPGTRQPAGIKRLGFQLQCLVSVFTLQHLSVLL